MAFTQKTDFVFKHVNQPGTELTGDLATVKANLDSQAKELRDYVNDTLLVEMASVTDGASGADKMGATPIAGLTGSTPQAIMESLKNKIDSVNPVAGFVNVKDATYGAKGDGVTDDSAAIQKAIDVLRDNGGGTLFTPPGNFVAGGLKTYSNICHIGAGKKSVWVQKSGSQYLVSINPGSDGTVNTADNITDVLFQNFQLKGTVETDGFSEFFHLLNINAGSNVHINKMKFTGWRGDAVYIGSGNVAGIERHNENITIRDCIFDGVNNNNRNGISVIDCNGLTIENNYFKNCTKVGMPGSIDVEVDANAFHIIKDIRIAKNKFYSNTGGYAISCSLNASSLVNPLKGLTIEKNFIDSSNTFTGASIFVSTKETIAASFASMAIKIKDNRIFPAIVPIAVKKVKDVEISGNTIHGCSALLLSDYQDATSTCMDVKLAKNHFKNSGNSVGMVIVGTVDNLEINGNTFDTPLSSGAPAPIAFFGEAVTTTSGNVKILNNHIIKSTSNITKVVHVSSHTLNAVGNRYENNTTDVTLTVGFTFTADDSIRQANIFAYDTTKLPDSFSVGEELSIVNGDAALPSSYKQGVLRTIKINSSSGYRKFIVQWFYSANNDATTLADIYFRKANAATNDWSAWKKLTGV